MASFRRLPIVILALLTVYSVLVQLRLDETIEVWNADISLDPPPCLVFLHIPKVGGRTIQEFLKSLALAVGFQEQPVYAEMQSPRNLKVHRHVTFGHFTVDLFRKRPDFQQCYKMTLLREPVDRAVSAFYYHGHHQGQMDECLDPDQKNKSCRLWWQYSNDMTRYLAGNVSQWNTYLEDDHYSPTPVKRDLENAKKNLQLFDQVCFLKDLTSCVERVMEVFQIEGPLPQFNTGMLKNNRRNKFSTWRRPKNMTDDDLEKFERINQLDIELYKEALAKAFYKSNNV